MDFSLFDYSWSKFFVFYWFCFFLDFFSEASGSFVFEVIFFYYSFGVYVSLEYSFFSYVRDFSFSKKDFYVSDHISFCLSF